MSQLPQTVRIKRKRQDEPVDTLHIQTKNDPNKRRFTEPAALATLTSIFKRVQEPVETSALSSAPPLISTTASTSSRPSSRQSAERKILTPHVTRRFHLSKGSYSGPPGGIQKRKNVATLIETKPRHSKTRKTEAPPAVADYLLRTTAKYENDVDMERDEPLQLKRPLTRSSLSKSHPNGEAEGEKSGVAKIPGRVDKDDKIQPTSEDNVDQVLLRQMQEFAQEVEEAEKSVTKPRYQPAVSATPQRLKFQPKTPQIARYRDRHPEDTKDIAKGDMERDDSDGDDGDYVYDTYIRYDGPHDTLVDPLKGDTLPPNVGLLVISEEDQPLWEVYLEDYPDQDSEGDFEDEEDENAEDFYGNEYPEDEVASDDEIGHGAYNYRVGASDDEEYGLSDEEEFNDLRRPWGRGRPAWLRDDGANADDSDNSL